MTREEFQQLIDDISPHVSVIKVDDDLYVVDGRTLERYPRSGNVNHGIYNVGDFELLGKKYKAADVLVNNARQQARDRAIRGFDPKHFDGLR